MTIYTDVYADAGITLVWPDTETGTVNDDITENGTPRPMTADEQTEWLAKVDADSRETDTAELRDSDFQLAKDERDQNAQDRQDMDETTGIGRWTRDITVAGTGDTVRLEQHARHLQTEVRQLKGSVRLLSAILVRMIRAQRLDE
jgi:hypothetical protein